MAMVETASGLIVPEAAADAGTRAKTDSLVRDKDGRRRVSLNHSETREVEKARRVLERAGFKLIIICDPNHKRPDRPSCGAVAGPDKDANDWAHVCQCSRIHFR